MVHINEEILMAYVDGELDPEEQAMVDELIQGDPEARAMVDQFRHTAELLQDNYREILDLPVPQRLTDAIQNYESDANIKEFSRSENNTYRFAWSRLALAASVTLSIGLMAGWLLFAGSGFNGASSDFALLVQKSLETQLSGTSRTSDNGRQTITPTLTFFAADGRVCREFEHLQNEQKSVGIACRENSGQWQVLAEIDHTLLAADRTENVANYRLAAGNESDPLGTLLSTLGAGKGLSTAEEQALKTRGWQKAKK